VFGAYKIIDTRVFRDQKSEMKLQDTPPQHHHQPGALIHKATDDRTMASFAKADYGFEEDDDEDSPRGQEIMVLQSMYEEEMEFSFGKSFEFDIKLMMEETHEVTLHATLSTEYPDAKAQSILSLQIPALERSTFDIMTQDLNSELDGLDLEEEPMKVLHAIDWLKEHIEEYLEQQASLKSSKAAAADKQNSSAAVANASSVSSPASKIICNGFMREWCSFVSLYKDSYIAGPNRFEVLNNLANQRGLAITGLAIAGKPGGLVVEGRESDVMDFMNLMRTEFFETLNPRGRKLTTRLQERWPLDYEIDRYEAARARKNLLEDLHQRARREQEQGVAKTKGNKQNKVLENERLAAWEKKDRQLLEVFENMRKEKMTDEEMNVLVDCGPPSMGNNASQVYLRLGQGVAGSDVDKQRKFSNFTVLTGGNNSGYETAYQDAGVLLTNMDMKHGFDAMFAYRFS
jgi:hypothetical protein